MFKACFKWPSVIGPGAYSEAYVELKSSRMNL